MKVNLKKASVKDTKPTILASELKGCLEERLILEIFVEGLVLTASFHRSRNGKTYYADNWIGPMPELGRPLPAEVRSIEIFSTLFDQS